MSISCIEVGKYGSNHEELDEIFDDFDCLTDFGFFINRVAAAIDRNLLTDKHKEYLERSGKQDDIKDRAKKAIDLLLQARDQFDFSPKDPLIKTFDTKKYFISFHENEKEFTTEASSLGLEPLVFPEKVEIIHNDRSFLFEKLEDDYHNGELAGVWYKTKRTPGLRLIIIND